jgi:hypothetical protein
MIVQIVNSFEFLLLALMLELLFDPYYQAMLMIVQGYSLGALFDRLVDSSKGLVMQKPEDIFRRMILVDSTEHKAVFVLAQLRLYL